LFNKKVRDFAFIQGKDDNTSEIEIPFTQEDLDNVIKIMSQAAISTDPVRVKYFSALTEFALVLLLPPRPLANNTISLSSYLDTLLAPAGESDVQNLLFCSIMAATDADAVRKILSLGKIDWVLEQLKKGWNADDAKEVALVSHYSQILFNCIKQKEVRDRYRATLPFDLYNLLINPNPDAPTLLRPKE
jgi:hypothetical protein